MKKVSLKQVEVREDPMDMDNESQEAMNHSEVETLVIGPKCKDIVSHCSYPKDKVRLDSIF